MATLEKIRSKSVFLLVVIFVALLAFILGDAITNGRNLFGNHTTVAKIGGKKIDYLDYQRKREDLNRQLENARQQNPEQFANFDVQLLPMMALNQLISETLLNDAVEKMGIKASPEMLRDYMFNSQPSEEQMAIVRQLQGMNVNVTSMEQVFDVIFNPKRNNLTQAQVEPLQKAWLSIEKDMAKQIAQQQYGMLLGGTIQANDLDKKALYNDMIATTDVVVAFRPYGQLDEKKYPVSDAELRNAYEAEKNKFKVDEPTKAVSFISVNVSPSDADRAASTKLAEQTAKELNDSNAQLSKNLRKEGLSVERMHLLASDVPAGPVKSFLDSARNNEVRIVSDNLRGFAVVKMGKRLMEADSITVNLVSIAGAKLPEQVLASLNSGLLIDSINTKFPIDSVFAQKEQGIALYDSKGKTSGISAAQVDSLKAGAGRYVKLMSTPDQTVIGKLVSQPAPKTVYEYDIVNYELHPSAKTLADARAKFEKFLADNPTAQAFKENAAKEGYNVQEFEFTQSTNAVPRMAGYNVNYPDSRQVVRWVMMEGKPGQVSHVYESNDAAAPALYAVAVNNAYEDYLPITNADVKRTLTDKVRRQKAGDELVKQYQGKAQSIESVASAMGVNPTEIEQFRMAGRNGMVNDATVIGTIAGSKPGQKVVVMKGDDGVYAFVVKGVKNENVPYDDTTYTQQYGQLINPNMEALLRGAKKLENNIYKFEAGD